MSLYILQVSWWMSWMDTIKPWHNPTQTGIGTYWAELHPSPPQHLRMGCNRSSASAGIPAGTPGSQLERKGGKQKQNHSTSNFRCVTDVKAIMKHVYQIMNQIQPKRCKESTDNLPRLYCTKDQQCITACICIYMSYVCTIEEILIQYLLMDTRKEQPFPQSRWV